MDLIGWIRKETVPVVAEKLGIAESTVQGWLYLDSAPQFDNAYKIKVISKGKLGFEEIYGPRFLKVAKLNKQK